MKQYFCQNDLDEMLKKSIAIITAHIKFYNMFAVSKSFITDLLTLVSRTWSRLGISIKFDPIQSIVINKCRMHEYEFDLICVSINYIILWVDTLNLLR